jgi:peroxiredoxin
MKNSFLIPASFLAISLLVTFGKSEEILSYTKVGDQIPRFSLTTLEGKTFDVEAMKGKIVLVNFWATWCPPCLVEMPELEKKIWQKRRGADFEMIAIAREEGIPEIKKFLEKNKFTFPMGPDPKRGIYSKFANAGIPRTYLIDRRGRILYQSVGYNTDDFEKLITILEKELKK